MNNATGNRFQNARSRLLRAPAAHRCFAHNPVLSARANTERARETTTRTRNTRGPEATVVCDSFLRVASHSRASDRRHPAITESGFGQHRRLTEYRSFTPSRSQNRFITNNKQQYYSVKMIQILA
mmetsp:Transcript_1441/g.3256  ORF Transcript_1441/g.3256 Transcript_1441/m.3256 type:complete len:125 (-) Transcript_1441:25-399(-)